MPSSLGGVILEGVIDADPQTPQDADGWPEVWPEQCTQDSRPPETLECAPQHSSRFLGRQLDGLDWYAMASRMGDRRLAVRTKVGYPAGLTVGRLHVPVTVESTIPIGTVLSSPDLRPRIVRSTFGAPVGSPAEISRWVSGLSRRRSRPATRFRRSSRGDARRSFMSRARTDPPGCDGEDRSATMSHPTDPIRVPVMTTRNGTTT